MNVGPVSSSTCEATWLLATLWPVCSPLSELIYNESHKVIFRKVISVSKSPGITREPFIVDSGNEGGRVVCFLLLMGFFFLIGREKEKYRFVVPLIHAFIG